MDNLLNKKRIIFIIVIILLVIVTGLYSSYAINVFYNEGIPLTYDQALDFSLSNELEQEVSVEANKTKVIDFDITNPYEGNIKYGLTYKMINPTTLPDGVIIAQSSESPNISVGMLEEDDSIIVSIIIVNNTDSNLTLSLGIVYGYENGGELILEDNEVLIEEEYQVGPLQGYKLILNMIENRNTDTPDFTKTSCSSGCEEATVGLYEYQDDLGTSYYFRGDVENNYVKFGKNASNQDMYWRIIRINGDGTVRMIYDGTQAWENGVANENRQIGTSAFNESMSDNAYVGYMYGQTGVTEAGTTGYNATHSNDNNSTIKTFLEGELTSNNTGWYYNNIMATGYHQYVADAIYCNDRSISEGTGIGNTETYYGAYERLWYTTDVNPQLTCANANDRFTISSSSVVPLDGKGTNKKLKYPIGLITADEVVLSGGVGADDNVNIKYYLYSGDFYITMTPSFLMAGYGFTNLFIFAFTDYLSNTSLVTATGSVKPVISLRSDALKYGTGVIGDEFRVEN